MAEVQLVEDFTEFLIDVKQSGYSSDKLKRFDLPNGGIEEVYLNDAWQYNNTYSGRNSSIGYETVSFRTNRINDRFWTPVWGMNSISDIIDPDFVFHFQRTIEKILSQTDRKMPIRGPINHNVYPYQYDLEVEGKLEKFTASETISKNEKLLYVAKFTGQLLNHNSWESISDKPWLTKIS